MVNYAPYTQDIKFLIKEIEKAYEGNDTHQGHELALQLKELAKEFAKFARNVNLGLV